MVPHFEELSIPHSGIQVEQMRAILALLEKKFKVPPTQ
jgi:hypothetical protein